MLQFWMILINTKHCQHVVLIMCEVIVNTIYLHIVVSHLANIWLSLTRFAKIFAKPGKIWGTLTTLMNTWPSLTISITYSFGQHDTLHILCICNPTNLSKGQEGSVSKVPTAAPTPIPTAAPTAEPTPVPTVFEQDFDFMWFAFRTMGMSPRANIISRIWKFGGLVLDYIEAEFWK